jgi:hypothetical protein
MLSGSVGRQRTQQVLYTKALLNGAVFWRAEQIKKRPVYGVAQPDVVESNGEGRSTERLQA